MFSLPTAVILNNIEKSKFVRDEAEKLGYKVYYHEGESVPLSEEELGCDVLVQHMVFKYNDISKFRNLKYVCAAIVGTDAQPIEELKKRGILYSNARGVYDIPISEFVVMRVLDIFKHSRDFDVEKAGRIWEKRHDIGELTGRRAAIVGTGGIGCETARRLSAFDVDCIGFSRSGAMKNYFKECYPIEMLAQKIGGCDIIVLCVPLESNTFHIFNAKMFENINKDAVLINVGRGALIDENALYDVLSAGKIKAAALDVFEKEPLDKNSPLWELDNFWYSPHNSFNSNKTSGRMAALLTGNLKAYIEGGKPSNLLYEV